MHPDAFGHVDDPFGHADLMDPNYWPDDLKEALEKWADTAAMAGELAVELKAARASAWLSAELPEGMRATDATRDAYASAQTRDLAIRAVQAEAEAKALGMWARFVLERDLQFRLDDTEGRHAG